LALKGADVILLPTNWPDGAQVSASTVCVARAAENKVWMVACNRIGVENGFRFIGQSKIISPSGLVVTSANEGEATLTATLDFALARDKHTVI
ncbi:carbon-nitrogen hydrolase family protein, partial [Acinetobacter baumannii]